MGTIFLSHSSRDDAAASALRVWLEAEGHQAIFLDHDAADGLIGGTPWEERLYTELRRCRALIALVDEAWLNSPWCVAEANHAQALRKPVLPLTLRPIDEAQLAAKAPPVLRRTQAIDWQRGAGDPEACARLRRGLLAAGLDPKDLFVWHGNRAPYPGLAAFQRDDAAVYFGREQEITDLLAILRECRAPDRARLVLVQGASGTGKSSLVRAGVLPRLERDPDNWIVVPPFRPLQAPLANLGEAFGVAGADIPAPAADGAPVDTASWVAAVQQMASALRRRAAKPDATVLVTVDQFEEVLGRTASPLNDQFLLVLRDTLAATDHRLLVLATLRADFTGTLQRHPALRDPAVATAEILPTRAFQLGPLPRAAFHAVVEGPAALAELQLEPGLASRLVAEAQTDDALPLLAFVLRELWDRFGADDLRLTHVEYDTLGGLEAAVGERAEKLVTAAAATPEELEAFRGLLVYGMADLSAEGRVLRRRLPQADVPVPARRLLEEFARARLVFADETGWEVAHEALFRRWTFLREGIEAARDSLAARRRVEEAFAAWKAEHADRDSRLLPPGRPLAEATALLDRAGALPDPEMRRYVEASAAALADSNRREQRRRRMSLAALAGVVLLAASTWGLFELFAWSDQQRALTETARERMIAANASRELASGRMGAALAIALEGVAPEQRANRVGETGLVGHAALWLSSDSGPREAAPQAVEALREVLWAYHERTPLRGHQGPVIAGAVSGDGARLLTAGEDGMLVMWDVATSAKLEPPDRHEAPVLAAALDASGRLAATAATDNTLQLWDMEDRRKLPVPTHEAAVLDLAFLPKRGLLATGGLDGQVRLWEPLRPETLRAFPVNRAAAILSLAVSPDERLLAASALDGSITIWNLDTGEPAQTLQDGRGAIRRVAFSDDSTMLVAASNDRGATLWDPRDGRKIGRMEGHEDWLLDARFSHDGKRVLTASLDGTARVWDVRDRRETCRMGAHEDAVSGAVFSADGQQVVTTSYDGVVRIWDLTRCRLTSTLRSHSGAITRLILMPSARSVTTLGTDGTARNWSIEPLARVDPALVPSNAAPEVLVGVARRLGNYRLTCPERQAYLAEAGSCTEEAVQEGTRRFADPRYFLEALSILLRVEGGSSEVVDGPGGPTKFNFTQKAYDDLRRQRGVEPRPVSELTRAEMQEFFRTDWWRRAGCDDLQPSLAMLHFDTAVQMGPPRAVVILQKQLDLTADGVLGPMTRSIVNERGLRGVATRYVDGRVEYYKEIAKKGDMFAKILPVWLRRTALIADSIGLPSDSLPEELKAVR
ncbi:TIR domain-containing protein [Variovorax rhizosphaerae]|uniref:TIR domain-containing protein n=1 Tax=Variovorax rhizosphaerae TaxID=1836200 RepID=A0ABU8WLW5_9BURK